jgi:hypothetical protein
MIVVPIEGDKIVTVDGKTLTVSSYNPMKKDESSGELVPSVYVDELKPKEGGIVLFEDIVEIRGVKVDFDKRLGMFNAMGPVRRPVQLPQHNDTVIIERQNETDLNRTDEGITVDKLKLSKAGGSYSLRIGFTEKGSPDVWYDLSKIIKINNGSHFNLKKFQKIYRDYFPYSWKTRN